MTPVICLELLYRDLRDEEKIPRIKAHGFDCVEFWSWRDKELSALRRACRECNVRVVNFSGHRVGSPIDPATHERFVADLRDATAAAASVGCGMLMLLSNELRPDGRAAETDPSLTGKDKRHALIEGMQLALAAAPPEISLVLEPLNDKTDHPGTFLRDMETARGVVESVGNPRLRVLADLYHMGVMGEDLTLIASEHVSAIGYVHIADIPGRHEPGTGRIDWSAHLKQLRESGYDGYVGFEYAPAGDSDSSLEAIRGLWDSTFPAY